MSTATVTDTVGPNQAQIDAAIVLSQGVGWDKLTVRIVTWRSARSRAPAHQGQRQTRRIMGRRSRSAHGTIASFLRELVPPYDANG